MAPQEESKIIAKIRWNNIPVILTILGASFVGMRMAYNWQNGILTAISETKTENAVLRSEISNLKINNQVSISEIKARDDRQDAQIATLFSNQYK